LCAVWRNSSSSFWLNTTTCGVSAMRHLLISTFDSRNLVPVTVMVVSPFFTGAASCACAGRLRAVTTTKSNQRIILRSPISPTIGPGISLTVPKITHFEATSSQRVGSDRRERHRFVSA
jgi:hypothetical protein